MSKTEVRSAIARQLNSLLPDCIRGSSSALAGRLFELRAWREAGMLLAYMSMTREVDTRPVVARALSAGKRVYLPRVEGDGLVFHAVRSLSEASIPHAYGMLEPGPDLPRLVLPLPPRSRALVLVPGVAFDREKNRLGRGRGFYDRFLSDFAIRAGGEEVFLLGIGFHLQLLDAVPCGPSDVPMDAVLTDKELLR
ncbi:MAG: 5-formyltetrahydrofolate cyclo-ligase [Spirochaetales bacterium]|nr:5-formyltetrahydrofolate cyclo-ligase [Spirochaetales bacterium]